MIKILFYIIFISLGGIFATEIADNNGRIFIDFGNNILIETKLVFIAIVLLLLAASYKLIKSILFDCIKYIKNIIHSRRKEHREYKRDLISTTTLQMQSEKWAEAECTIKKLSNSEINSSVTNCLYLAQIHHKKKQYKQRDKYLQQINKIDKKIDLTAIKIKYLTEEDIDKAEAYIDELNVDKNSSKEHLNAAWKVYTSTKKYDKLINLLDVVNKIENVDKADLKQVKLQHDTQGMIKATNCEEVEEEWERMGFFKKRDDLYINEYIKKILEYDKEKAKAKLLESINSDNEFLIKMAKKIIKWQDKNAEKTLLKLYKDNKKNMLICETIIDICVTSCEYETATRIIKELVSNNESSNKDTFKKMAEILEKQEKTAEAAEYYKLAAIN